MVPNSPPPPHAAPPRGWAAFVGALTGRSVLVAMVLAVIAALLLTPLFQPPFPVMLGRMLFVAMVLLMAFTAAGQMPADRLPEWMPRWLLQVLAVALAAPLATLVVYALYVGGNVPTMFNHPGIVTGFVWITCTGLAVGLVLSLGALYRERDAQARSQALAFALERETLERQALDARLALLQSQIEPHFLFNTLANVQALVESGSPRAAPVLKSLIDYLRASVPRLQAGDATLGDEETRVRAYLELMLMRMPDRLRYDVRIDPALRALRFPAMALLTLVENAVRHGIDPGEEGGAIEVGAARDGARVRLWVADTGVGMAESAQPGTGLANLRARLQGAYGPAARLTLSEHAPHGLHAEIEFQAP